MQYVLIILITTLSFGFIEANPSIDRLYSQFNCENISKNEIQQWLNQFESEDQESAILLLDQIQYFTYKRIMGDLKLLHKKLLPKLKSDGFIKDPEKEMVFESVDFSKIFPAKSGDLISYLYRSSNMIRAVAFKNLTDLTIEKKDHSNKALVLLDDYLGTGTQFLYRVYSKQYNELFNGYKKVYFVVLVSTKSGISKFDRIANADYESVGQDFISILGIQDENKKQELIAGMRKIPKDKIELVYLHQEIPINDSSRNPEETKKS